MVHSLRVTDQVQSGMDSSLTDEQYLELARRAANSQSDDPKAKWDPRARVGSVLVDRLGNVFSSANEVPQSVKGLLKIEDANSPERYHFIEHAERAVIYKASLAGAHLSGATIYCTRFPCSDCARTIVAFGIKRLVVGDGFDNDGRWIESQRAARSLLMAAGVRIRYLPN